MNIRKCLLWMSSVVVSVFLIAGSGIPQNAVPMLINYQGMLRDPTTGEPVPDGEYDMVFHIYDLEFGGTYLWKGSHDSLNGNPVPVQDGLFTVLLGSGTGPPLTASLFNGADRWLEIVLEGETLEPRQRLASVPYSIVSENSRLLDGQEASNFASALHLHSGDDIDDGIVSEKWIDAAIARDSELATHAADSAAHHKKTTTFAELTDTASDAQIPAGIARDAEIMPTVLASDGSGSTLDADLLDGKDSTEFASLAHTHDANAIISGNLDDARFSAYGDLEEEGYLDNTGADDLLTAGQADMRFWGLTGNSGTDPATHFLGTADNQAMEFRVDNARALRLEPNATSPNIVGGYAGNSVMAGVLGATIAGGGRAEYPNSVTDDYGTIGGGFDNQAGDNAGTTTDHGFATVSGGRANHATRAWATVGGGTANTASGLWATVGGGRLNTATTDYAAVAGGNANMATGHWATVAGGGFNTASGECATVGGGQVNEAKAAFATIAGGGPSDPGNADTRNLVSGDYGTIGGGGGNQVVASYATVGGGAYNEAGASYATIAGGGPTSPADPLLTRNVVTDDYGTIGGGGWNQAGDNAGTTTDATHATVAGGGGNVASGASATVGGGSSNTASGGQATVAGGSTNTASNTYATVGGGSINTASGHTSTVAGGTSNTASSTFATVGGGRDNTAGGSYGTVPGGRDNVAKGDYGFAAGRRAVAGFDGCFVWGDSLDFNIEAWQANEFVARATGGFWFITEINEKGDPIEGMRLPAGSSKWLPIGTTAAQSSLEGSDYVQKLEADNTSLRERIDDLESRLAVLEALIQSGGGVQE